jgi:hypothetical protein
MKPDNHTRGELYACEYDAGWCGLYSKNGDLLIAEATNEDVPTEPTVDNARLLAAAFTSYDAHCGQYAVACAEEDLLGEALEACRKLIDAIDNCPGDDLGQRAKAEAFLEIRAVLAKQKGGE